MDFDSFTSELCTTNPNIAHHHNKISDNNSINCPAILSELPMEGNDDFDGIVPMQLDDFFESHTQQRTNERQQQTKREQSEKTVVTRESFLCPSVGPFFSLHHQQQHISPAAAARQHFAHLQPNSNPFPLPLPSAQFIASPNAMADYANNTNNNLGPEFCQRSHSHNIYSSTIDQHPQKAAQWSAQWHQYPHRQQWHDVTWPLAAEATPLRKESMPALHFNCRHLQPSASLHFSNGVLPFQHQSSPLPQTDHPLERTRSLSSAIFCPTSSSAIYNYDLPNQQQSHFHANVAHSTDISISSKWEEQRRTKSTALPPTSLCNSLHFGPASLRRFNSQLRSPCHSADVPLLLNPSAVKPYTPPPILSPMRNGSGLFHRIVQEDSKFSPFDLSKPCSISETTDHFETGEITMTDEAVAEEEEDERRNIARKENGGKLPLPVVTFIEQQNGMEAEEESGAERRTPLAGGATSAGSDRPQRKNGFLFSAGDGPCSSGLPFAAELEQLRKQSTTSGRTHKASIIRMSIRNKTSLANDDFIRKMSTVSMEEAKGEEAVGSEEVALESAAIPHINLGKGYQAKVKKWSERAISAQEREAIADRDQPMFESRAVEHIPETALAAYETLACSVAVPKPGRNKELALNVLAENQGNLQAAVMDLLRCDTLDWEQYPNIFKNSYVDVDDWSPEEINTFQDAIYKSEKDFQQVATELGNRSVRECVSFYYTWKKACPDDYRKLRNLRKKRQLLEQQLDYASIACRQLSHSESQQNGGTSEEEEGEEFSETESDITNPSLLGHLSMECSPAGLGRKHSLPRGALPPGDFAAHPSSASSLLPNTSSALFNSAYPWLHGEIFPSPSSSSTSTANNDHLQGAQNGTTNAGGEMGTTDRTEGTQQHHNEYGGGHHHNHHHKIRSVANAKKGAQPSADGFFHCRLCEKRFEKVKSLNAHMKSHAMKARAEAEVQMQHKQQQQSTALPFPVPTKKEAADSALGSLAAPLGPVASLNLTSSQAAVAAALNNLNRQFQQQQGQAVQEAMGGIMGSNLLLRNMLQYGPAAAAAAAQGGAAATPGGTASQWPTTQHFNA
ncbi:hypothetical protein niasHS_010791 [Heterodera schachtii]|uniref:Transcriptional-regulating factor 1 n=1 Tax=Heterodera schachtii TaxID=97005 RepID=A0ABD2ISL6_HETSC